ncbi:MAG: metallophosphatase [Flavobacterium sp. BFFFF2]|nr:MAG: metallophosphatase [Flavobacterium sp. BFFFF2]
MNRRSFVKNTFLTTAAAAAFADLSLSSFQHTEDELWLTILHTNDVHSYIDPFPANHPKNPNMGGVARRAALIESVRKENPNTLLVDSGDIFQGTPYFNYFGGELEFKLMSMMGYELATLGNHDFDNGIDGLLRQMPHAKFDFVSANYDFKNTPLDGHVKPYKIIQKAGLKIGIFGLGVALDGLVDKKNSLETVYLDPIEMSQEMVKQLQRAHCDLIICLSHIGYKYKDDPNRVCDLSLAAQTQGIDFILGGHTHTFLDKPTVVKNIVGQDVVVNQAGCYGLQLGRIDVYFDRFGNSQKAVRTIQVS